MMQAMKTANEFHDGQWTALYSFSSTGIIHGPMHRELLMSELKACLDFELSKEDRAAVCATLVFLWTAPTNVRLHTAKMSEKGKFIS